MDSYDFPCCFACGREFDVNSLGSLQKAHIIPHSMGGSEEPDNMLLLCPVCHRNSPDTTTKESMISWLYKERKQPPIQIRKAKQVVDILVNDYGFNDDDFAIISDYILTDECRQYLHSHIGFHGGSISDQSSVYGMVEFVIKKRNEVALYENQNRLCNQQQ